MYTGGGGCTRIASRQKNLGGGKLSKGLGGKPPAPPKYSRVAIWVYRGRYRTAGRRKKPGGEKTIQRTGGKPPASPKIL